MLNIAREQIGNFLEVSLFGPIEENASLDQLMGTPAPLMRVICRGVTRINSVGVKSWIRYFSDAHQKGSRFRFVECSPPIVEQMNMISNFTCGGEVESIYVPYACGSCKKELLGLFLVKDLKCCFDTMPRLKCTYCGSRAEFDDIGEEYFAFVQRERSHS